MKRQLASSDQPRPGCCSVGRSRPRSLGYPCRPTCPWPAATTSSASAHCHPPCPTAKSCQPLLSPTLACARRPSPRGRSPHQTREGRGTRAKCRRASRPLLLTAPSRQPDMVANLPARAPLLDLCSPVWTSAGPRSRRGPAGPEHAPGHGGLLRQGWLVGRAARLQQGRPARPTIPGRSPTPSRSRRTFCKPLRACYTGHVIMVGGGPRRLASTGLARRPSHPGQWSPPLPPSRSTRGQPRLGSAPRARAFASTYPQLLFPKSSRQPRNALRIPAILRACLQIPARPAIVPQVLSLVEERAFGRGRVRAFRHAGGHRFKSCSAHSEL